MKSCSIKDAQKRAMKFVNSTSCSSSSCTCSSNCCCCSSGSCCCCCCPVIISCKNILMHSCRTSCINMLHAPKEMPENYPAIMSDKSVELLLNCCCCCLLVFCATYASRLCNMKCQMSAHLCVILVVVLLN